VQSVADYVEITGNAAAVNAVKLVARVEGIMAEKQMTAFHQLNRSRRVLRTAGMGHKERFPRPRPNGRCGFRKRPFAADD
jgi:hypothetical protein